MEKVWRRSKEVTRVVGLSSGSEVNELGQTSTLRKLAPQPGEQQWAQHIQGAVRTEGAGGWTRTVCTMIGTVSRINICSMGGWDPHLSNWHSSRLTLNTLAGVKFLLLWFPLLPVTKVSAFCPPPFFKKKISGFKDALFTHSLGMSHLIRPLNRFDCFIYDFWHFSSVVAQNNFWSCLLADTVKSNLPVLTLI